MLYILHPRHPRQLQSAESRYPFDLSLKSQSSITTHNIATGIQGLGLNMMTYTLLNHLHILKTDTNSSRPA